MTYAEELEIKGREIGLQLGSQEGQQAGLQQGRQEEQQAVAKELLKSGISNAVIIKATHLTLNQIEKLKKSLN